MKRRSPVPVVSEREPAARAKEIAEGMKPWFRRMKPKANAPFEYPDMRAHSVEDRTPEQRIWDHAVLACAEFIRRWDNYDETRALALHEAMLTQVLPKEGGR